MPRLTLHNASVQVLGIRDGCTLGPRPPFRSADFWLYAGSGSRIGAAVLLIDTRGRPWAGTARLLSGACVCFCRIPSIAAISRGERLQGADQKNAVAGLLRCNTVVLPSGSQITLSGGPDVRLGQFRQPGGARASRVDCSGRSGLSRSVHPGRSRPAAQSSWPVVARPVMSDVESDYQ